MDTLPWPHVHLDYSSSLLGIPVPTLPPAPTALPSAARDPSKHKLLTFLFLKLLNFQLFPGWQRHPVTALHHTFLTLSSSNRPLWGLLSLPEMLNHCLCSLEIALFFMSWLNVVIILHKLGCDSVVDICPHLSCNFHEDNMCHLFCCCCWCYSIPIASCNIECTAENICSENICWIISWI